MVKSGKEYETDDYNSMSTQGLDNLQMDGKMDEELQKVLVDGLYRDEIADRKLLVTRSDGEQEAGTSQGDGRAASYVSEQRYSCIYSR